MASWDYKNSESNEHVNPCLMVDTDKDVYLTTKSIFSFRFAESSSSDDDDNENDPSNEDLLKQLQHLVT